MGTPMREWPFGGTARTRWPRTSMEWSGVPAWRAPDRWGNDVEPFPGAGALEDVAIAWGRGAADEGVAAAAAARVAVVQLALAAEAGRLAGELLEDARAAAAGYVRASGCGRAEAAALAAAVAHAAVEPEPALTAALDEAAAAAASAGYRGGAASLWRTGYRIARRRRWPTQAALAATGMEALARAGGSRAAARLWHARAERQARRAV